MEFDVQTNTNELENDLKLQGCPSDLQINTKEVVTEYWDVFCEDGSRRPIRGFSFQIDTVNYPLIFYKPPSHGPHKSEVMKNLV